MSQFSTVRRILSSLLAERAACYSRFMKVVTKSAIETKKFARGIAMGIVQVAASQTRQRAIIIGLQGELGSGKTTFTQGFLEYFGIQRVTSPTFVMIKKYSYKNPKTKTQNPSKIQSLKSSSEADPPWVGKFQTLYLYHIDCYRIKNSRDLLDLGFEEMINNPDAMVLIEWAEKIQDILPKDVIWIKFRHRSEKERGIEFFNFQ